MPTTLQYSEPPWLCLPKMPGRYNITAGYVYALICSHGVVKIGSTVHPGRRIGEQCRWGYIYDGGHPNRRRVRVKRIVLSGAHRRCRAWEKLIQGGLRPFQIGHHLNEKFKPSRFAMAALTRLFEQPLSGQRIEGFITNLCQRGAKIKGP